GPSSGSFGREGSRRSSAPRDGTNGPSDSEGSRGARCRKEVPHLGGVQELTPLRRHCIHPPRRRASHRRLCADTAYTHLGGVQATDASGPTLHTPTSAACKPP